MKSPVPRRMALATLGAFSASPAFARPPFSAAGQSASVQMATMFTVCSRVMIVVQTAVLLPLVEPAFTRWLVAPAFGILAVSLFAVPLTARVIGAAAASAGILSPILTYWIRRTGGPKIRGGPGQANICREPEGRGRLGDGWAVI